MSDSLRLYSTLLSCIRQAQVVVMPQGGRGRDILIGAAALGSVISVAGLLARLLRCRRGEKPQAIAPS